MKLGVVALAEMEVTVAAVAEEEVTEGEELETGSLSILLSTHQTVTAISLDRM